MKQPTNLLATAILGYLCSIDRIYDDDIYFNSPSEGKGVIGKYRFMHLAKLWASTIVHETTMHIDTFYSIHSWVDRFGGHAYVKKSIGSEPSAQFHCETEFEAVMEACTFIWENSHETKT